MFGLTKKAGQLILAVALGVLGLLIISFLIGRGCNRSPIAEPPVTTIDPTKIEAAKDKKLTDADRKASAQLAKAEEKFTSELETFDRAQSAEYAAVKKEGPKATAKWLTDFNRRVRQKAP